MKKFHLIFLMIVCSMIIIGIVIKIAMEISPLFTEGVGFLLLIYFFVAFYMGHLASELDKKRGKKPNRKPYK